MADIVEKCGECEFAKMGPDMNLFCHANPPVPLLIPVADPRTGQVTGMSLQGTFPPIRPDGWCGAFEPVTPTGPVNDPEYDTRN